MNIGAIGSGGRRRARQVVCLSNLRQWGVIWSTYCNDNNGDFCGTGNLGWKRGAWIIAVRPYIESGTKFLCCPEATRRHPLGVSWGGPFDTYAMGTSEEGERVEEGSYGANCWIYKPMRGQDLIQGRPTAWNWKTPNVEGAARVPLFADTMFPGGGPFYHINNAGSRRIIPPKYNGQWLSPSGEMMHFCIDRHNGSVNHLFMDWSARKVGLKELWTLKWHRSYYTCGPWTKCGGAQPEDWPKWMRNFKDY
jgi:hypothetical protein